MKTLVEISKLIALVLRHKPEELGLKMDKHGWVSAQELIEKLNDIQPFTREMLEQIVREDNKQRYSFNENGAYIRANQGHSIPVDLGFEPQTPPKLLWHGTSRMATRSILQNGLQRMERQYVHLSEDMDTAITVGKRRGDPVIFIIDTQKMLDDGCVFYRSENGVWLTDEVLPKYFDYFFIWLDPEWFAGLTKRAKELNSHIRVAPNALAGRVIVERLRKLYLSYESINQKTSMYAKPLVYVYRGVEDYVFSDGIKFYCAYIPQDFDFKYGTDSINWKVFRDFDDVIDEYGYTDRSRVPLERMPRIFLHMVKRYNPHFGHPITVYAGGNDDSPRVAFAAMYKQEGKAIPELLELRLTLQDHDGKALKKKTLILDSKEKVVKWLEKADNQAKVIAEVNALSGQN